MLSTALCLGGRIDRVAIGSAGLGMRHETQGSHPWLDHHYSTEAVAVHHAQAAMTRLDKTRLIADWPEGLSVLRPCLAEVPGDVDQMNCGKCEKCIRTMLALLALGKLDTASSFPFRDVTPEMLDPAWIDNVNCLPYYTGCIDALGARGRIDLVARIQAKENAWRRWQRREGVMRFFKGLAGST